jgi:type III pantothenate kinase
MSAWLFDLGNSRLKYAPLSGDRAGPVTAIAHDGHRFPAGWEASLPPGCTRACVASVAPAPLLEQLRTRLLAQGADVERVQAQADCDGVRIAYADPARLGIDRFLALLAAHAQCREDALVVGVGTALTLDLLGRDGSHRGGRIAPSPTLMRQALHARAPHLPESGGRYVAFADDTASALASGCEGAAVALVEHSLDAAGLLLGAMPTLLVHGGGAQPLLAHLPRARSLPALVLDGLARWAVLPR